MSKLLIQLASPGMNPRLLFRALELSLLVALVYATFLLVNGFKAGEAPVVQSQDSIAGDPGSQLQTWSRPRHDQPSSAMKSLFGMPVQGSMSADGIASGQYRETGLDLVLKGVLAERGTDRKVALIENAGHGESVYWTGDMIAGAKIVRIESRRVVIDHNGVIEALSLETLKAQAQYQAKETKENPVTAGVEPRTENHQVIRRQTVAQQVTRLPELLQQASSEPYLDKNGRAIGIRLGEIPGESIFSDLGFRGADVIRSVNGKSIHNSRDAIQAYRDLKSASAFSINLLRDGREITLNYSIQ